MNENETPNVNVDPVTPDPVPQDAPYVQPAVEPAPKKGFPKLILFIALAAVLVVGGFFGIRAIAGGTPLARAMTGVKKSFEALEKNEHASILKNVSESGSINVSVDLSKLTDLMGGAEVPAKVELTTYANLKNYKAALEIDAQLKNKSILHGTLTASDEELAVACEQILGKKNYSLSLKDLAKNLPKSIFDPDSDTDYALPEEIYEWLTGLKNGPVTPLKEIISEAKPVLENAAKVLKTSTEKNAEISKGSETISIGEADVKTNTVTVKLNGKQAAAIVTDLFKWAKSDKDLKNLLTKAVTTYGPIIDKTIDAEDFLDGFYDSIDEALEEMEDTEKDDVNLTAVFYTSKSNGQLVKAEITNKDEYGKTTYTLEGGPDWKDLAYYSFSMKDPYSKTSVTYNVEENTKSQFTAKIKVKEDSDTTMSATYSWDKSTGDVRITSSEADFKLTGTMTQKGKVTTIELKKLEYGRFISIKDMGVTVTLNESAKLPSISKTTEVVKLSEDDIEMLVEDVQDAIQDLMEKIQDEMN